MADSPDDVVRRARPSSSSSSVCDTLMLQSMMLQSKSGRAGPPLREERRAALMTILHPGVRCNACRRSFAVESLARSIRYMCLQCDDYDLCPACMRLGHDGTHADDGPHDFIVVRDSRDRDLAREKRDLVTLE